MCQKLPCKTDVKELVRVKNERCDYKITIPITFDIVMLLVKKAIEEVNICHVFSVPCRVSKRCCYNIVFDSPQDGTISRELTILLISENIWYKYIY